MKWIMVSQVCVPLVILFLKVTKTHPPFLFLLLVLGHVCIESFPLLHRVTRVENSLFNNP